MHLVLVALSQSELRQTGRYPKLDRVEAFFDRAGSTPCPDGAVSNYFYGPSDAFDYAALYEIGSREELRAYAEHAYEMVAGEFSEEEQAYLQQVQQRYLNTLIPRDSEAYFEKYRTVIYEEHDYTRSSTRYVMQGLQSNEDGTLTLILEQKDYYPPALPEHPDDMVFDSFLTVRMTAIDLPADQLESGSIVRVQTPSGKVLWEKEPA